MSFSNRQFCINGPMRRRDLFKSALELGFEQNGPTTRAVGYRLDPTHGFILDWCKSTNTVCFPRPLLASAIDALIFDWLLDPDVSLTFDYWDADVEHDGSNEAGWKIYCRDWGRIDIHESFLAIKPVFVWYGK